MFLLMKRKRLTLSSLQARFPVGDKRQYLTIFFGRQFSSFKCEGYRRQISPNTVKYRSTRISKVFDNYYQISSEFMTYAIEFHMFSKDPASKKKQRCASFKT